MGLDATLARTFPDPCAEMSRQKPARMFPGKFHDTSAKQSCLRSATLWRTRTARRSPSNSARSSPQRSATLCQRSSAAMSPSPPAPTPPARRQDRSARACRPSSAQCSPTWSVPTWPSSSALSCPRSSAGPSPSSSARPCQGSSAGRCPSSSARQHCPATAASSGLSFSQSQPSQGICTESPLLNVTSHYLLYLFDLPVLLLVTLSFK